MARKSKRQRKGNETRDYIPDPEQLNELSSKIRPLAKLRIRLTYAVLLILLIFGGPKSVTGILYFIIGTIFIMIGSFQRFGAAATIVKASGDEEDVLITSGPYSKCAHPLYFGSLMQGLGFVLIAGPASDLLISVWTSAEDNLILLLPWGLIPFVAILVPVYQKMMATEEAYLSEKFGPAYLRYLNSTPKIIPRLNIFTRDPDWKFDTKKLEKNREKRNFAGLMLVWVLFFVKMLYSLVTIVLHS